MLETIIKQFFQSGTGSSVVDQLRQQGLDAAQTRSAIAATIEGAMKESAAEGGMTNQTSGLSAGAESASGISPQVAQFVAQRAGIDPTIAQKVVSIALPKVLELVQSNSIPGARPSGGGLLSALPNLRKH